MSRFVFFVLGVLVVGALQYGYWLGDSGYSAARSLDAAIEREQHLNARLEQRNRVLAAEVKGLKSGLEAVEARARTDLGMVVEGETFYLVVDEDDIREGASRSAAAPDRFAPTPPR